MGATENEAKFTITGKVSLYIMGIVITFILGLGTMTSNYYALEKRMTAIEQREEKACAIMNQILILNGRIEEKLGNIKESLKDHITSSDRGGK